MNILMKFAIGVNLDFPVLQRPITKWGFSKWGLQRTLANVQCLALFGYVLGYKDYQNNITLSTKK